MRKVRLRRVLIGRIGVREWGRPSVICPGKMYRSESHSTITCLLPRANDMVRFETRDLVEVEEPEDEWMPARWRDAMRYYCFEWPTSATYLSGMVRLTEDERLAIMRDCARRVLSEKYLFAIANGTNLGEWANPPAVLGQWGL